LGRSIGLLAEKYPPDPGGLAISTRRLAELLHQSGCQVRVFSLSSNLEPGRFAWAEHRGIPVCRLGEQRRAEDTLADWFDCLVEAHRQQPFDLLHAYFITKAGFVAVYTGRYLGLPSVVSARGNDLERAAFDPGKFAHILYALQNASAVTANATSLACKAEALAPGRLVTVIPNGVDVHLFSPAQRDARLAEQLGLGELPVIGFAGEARAKKGLADALLAFKALAGRRPAALLLAGGVRPGEDEGLLRVFQKQNPALHLVVTPNLPQEDLPAYYNLMDVLLMPSRRDGLPNALLEGMACERAVLATAVGGMLDALRHDENGLLVPPGEPAALADSLETLLADPNLRLRLGRSARQTVLQQFTLEQELAGNLAVYSRWMDW
jgi:glycosyltransferase involved in cell wall biosynthesis